MPTPPPASSTAALFPGASLTLAEALRRHWPEYLIEGWALGMFMISAGLVATALGAPDSFGQREVASPLVRNALAGAAMGVTAMMLTYSPWGMRSGAHMNPAITLTFLRLGKMRGSDALFFVLAQTIGGTIGVLLLAAALGPAFTQPPVSYAATLPGAAGPAIAFAAEFGISALLMFVILLVSGSRRARLTGIAAGCLVAIYIALESPLSGMSMNPARTFASAAPGMHWQHFWIYLCAPVPGMLLGAEIYLATFGSRQLRCAKLVHSDDIPCIHCGFQPAVDRGRGSHD